MVIDLWVRAEVFDELAASMEESQMILKDKSLKGENRKEMSMKELEEMKIRSVVMRVDVIINRKIISKLLGVSNTERLALNTKERSMEDDMIKTWLCENSSSAYEFGNMKNMKTTYKILFNILIGCLTPREGSTNQISWDHRHFIWYLENKENTNLHGYIFHHLCESMKDSKKHKK